MSTLLTAIAPHDTSFTPSHLYLRTTYPHLPPRPVQDPTPLESGRRRRAVGRGQLGGMLAVEALTPVKGRKRAREDEDSQPTPRRERESTSNNSHRRGGTNTAKTRKCVNLLSLLYIGRHVNVESSHSHNPMCTRIPTIV